MSSRPVAASLALLAVAGLVSGKNVKGTFQLTAGDEHSGPEFEIAKFSFAVGDGKIKGTIRYDTNDMNWHTSPALYLFNDDQWDAYHKAPACMDKVEVAHTVVQIGSTSDEKAGGRRQRSTMNYGYKKLANSKDTTASVRMLPNNKVEWRFEWKINHAERTKGWFLIAADCALEQFNTKVAPMTYDITLLNPSNDQLPANEHWLPTMYILVIIVCCVHIGYCLNVVSTTVENSKRIHLIVKLFALAYGMQVLSLLMELMHLFIYSINGRGIWILDFASEITEGFCSLIISFVLICLACGWTLVDEEANSRNRMSVATILRDPKSMLRSGNWLGYILVLCLLGIISYTMLLLFWNKLSDEDFTKFHDIDTKHGTRLLQIRMGLFVFFAVSVTTTLWTQKQKSGSPVLRSFLFKLLSVGSLWFISFPLMVFIANMAAHYNRHRIVVTGVVVMQAFCLGSLSHQFLAESSTYARLSTAWESGILPGAGGLFTGSKLGAID
ncbi:hypothetical protein DIPPA_26028 [Diplonema papillatum]|nr:hypothetical protein DIPPA_26028 [Diplonema papillatum]